jgi:proton-dependent oligopeptide transporter, POT family
MRQKIWQKLCRHSFRDSLMMNIAMTSINPSKHPKGLYVLFATEMWERFSFYSMLALFTLYLRNPDQGFGWTAVQATTLYSTYLFFVYFSPLVGGFLADRKLGYRKAVMIGGLFFMAGHGLLSFRSMIAVYAALTCLVIGNGLFKPNVSTMVGNLYPEGSHLKDRAYNIFYMGINVGAFIAPIIMEIVKNRFGYHPAFAVAAFGMLLSVSILWWFRRHVENQAHPAADLQVSASIQNSKHVRMESVPEWKRVAALILIFLIVIVFWMVFHQNGSTLTYWADDNTDWNVSGTIANAINPFWIITLTFPLVWFWKKLDERGREPSTPSKMAIGMFLTAISFYILFCGAKIGEMYTPTSADYSTAAFRITDRTISSLRADGVPAKILSQLDHDKIKGMKFAPDDKGSGEVRFTTALNTALGPQAEQYRNSIMRRAYIFRVSPLWLVLAYMVISLGELMLSPMGLSLVSKVAPLRLRGFMMGGWFVATAIGNKLTMIGVFWERWFQSTFFVILGTLALMMAFILLALLRPLKKAMPGV